MRAPEHAIARQEGTVDIAAPPDVVYALVADLPRMGEWSPECIGGSWKDGGTGAVGDWFEGRNRAGDREWSRDCEVAAADPGRDFTFVVGGVEHDRTWWSYELEPTAGGTRLTERWWIVNKSPALLEATVEQFQARVDMTKGSIDQTLAGIKATAEGA